MKPRLTSILLALIAIPATTYTADADVIGGGVFYDVGKYSYSSDSERQMPEGSSIESDEWYCWAAAASNATQYWQDFYYNQKDADVEVPNGIAQSGAYSQPSGTTYLSVYQEALKKGLSDETGSPTEFYEWWVNGGTVEGKLGSKEAYYSTLFDGSETSQSIAGEWGESPSLEQLTTFIVESFKTEGQAVSLAIAGTASHAISCWGYELDPETQMLSSLLLSCSDDQRFSVFRVDVEEKDCYSDMAMWAQPGMYMEHSSQISLVTDEQAGYYGHDWTWVTEAHAIKTPSGTPLDVTAPTMQTTLSAGQTVTQNTSLAESTAIKGAGVVIGDGKSTIVVTASNPEVSLAMDGTTEEGGKSSQTGMQIKDGGTVSLQDFTVENYEGGGIEATGRLYLHNGDVKIADNATSSDGGGINNTSYVEISNGGKVIFENNMAEGKGGAINNVNTKPVSWEIDRLHHLIRGEAYYSDWGTKEPNYTTLSIRGNSEVVFKGNGAAIPSGGNDIYNSGSSVVNIADNENVRFEGTNNSVAVRNEGYLFMSAETGKSIDFVDSSLQSVGDAAIGMDVSGRTTDAAGTINFYDASEHKKLSLSSRYELGGMVLDEESGLFIREYTIPALLTNVSVNASEIMGLGTTPAESSVTDTLIQTNNPLLIKQLTMDATDAIISTSTGDVALDTVVFDLTGVEISEGNVVDLTQMLTGNFTFSEVQFLMAGEVDSEVLEKITFDLSKAYTEAEEAQIKELIKLYAVGPQGSVEIKTDNVTFIFAQERIPEPATGTLSLLALAGLAARRRRK